MDPINGNGTLIRAKKKKTHSHHPHQQPQQHHAPPLPSSVYRECLKNHAASLGGHALDGCGEFMPSPSSNPSDPSSLTCAACSCHRNFHRRLSVFLPFQEDADDDDAVVEDREEDEDRDGGGEEEEDVDRDRDVSCSDQAHSTSPPPQSATHMLLALSTGHPASGGAGPAQQQQQRSNRKGTAKRFRTKFSQEQKEKMLELSERLGWRMQRRDEAVVEAACREIGVGRGVFKVWMHNNKHIFTKKSNTIRSDPVSSSGNNGNGVVSEEGGGGGVENLEMRFNGAATSA